MHVPTKQNARAIAASWSASFVLLTDSVCVAGFRIRRYGRC